MLAARVKLLATLLMLSLAAAHFGCNRDSQSAETGNGGAEGSLFRNLGKR